MIIALAGGVGGARLAKGLALALPADRLAVVVNVGDDFEHLGLHVSPDIDTVLYTLAGLANPATGWGREGESWQFMAALSQLGGENWFQLGDLDLATHVERTHRLRSGEPLSAITARFAERLGIGAAIVPVTDAPLRTMVDTDEGTLAFQEYFVHRQCRPRVTGFRFEGAAATTPSAPLAALMARDDIEGIVVCPSNPWLSIDPLLAVPGLRKWIEVRGLPVVAVSPIVGGKAVKGPAGKIMDELGIEVSALGVARHYGAGVQRWVIDERDAALAPQIEKLNGVERIESIGRRVRVTDTMMTEPPEVHRLSLPRTLRLAEACLEELAAARGAQGRAAHRA